MAANPAREIRNTNGVHRQMSKIIAAAKVEELDGNQIIHDAKKLRAGARAATRQRERQAKRFKPLNQPQQDRDSQDGPR